MAENTVGKTVMIVDDEESIRNLLKKKLEREGFEVLVADHAARGLDVIEERRKEKLPEVNAIVTDIKMPQMDGFEFLEAVQTAGCLAPVIFITGHGDKACAIEALHKGAFDYVEKPFDMNDISLVVRRAVEKDLMRRENHRLVDELKVVNKQLETKLEVTTNLLGRDEAHDKSQATLIGDSDALKNLKNTVRTIAEGFRGDNDPVVLITGESGVGKEMVARYIHDRIFSLRTPHGKTAGGNSPFVAINCAAFPEQLLESELFGYEKGAFTGAQQRKLGLFELADGGTLFLDEIGEMDLRMQAKLLRVLQERVIRRLGGTQDIPVRPQIIAATNRDLASAVQGKTFREDLYYRLSTLPLVIPPLRSRSMDIAPLAKHFLESLSKGRTRDFQGFSHAALKAMDQYRWPGNVRELRSVIERAVILEQGPMLELSHFRQESMGLVSRTSSAASNSPSNVTSITPEGAASAWQGLIPTSAGALPDGMTLSDLRKNAEELFVKQLLIKYLEQHQGNVSAVARLLKIDRANLLRLFRRYHLDAALFRTNLKGASATEQLEEDQTSTLPSNVQPLRRRDRTENDDDQNGGNSDEQAA